MNRRTAKKIMVSDNYWVSTFNNKGNMFVAARSPKHTHLLDKAFTKLGDTTFISNYKKNYELFCNGKDLPDKLLKQNRYS